MRYSLRIDVSFHAKAQYKNTGLGPTFWASTIAAATVAGDFTALTAAENIITIFLVAASRAFAVGSHLLPPKVQKLGLQNHTKRTRLQPCRQA